jgi:hypothetical protein
MYLAAFGCLFGAVLRILSVCLVQVSVQFDTALLLGSNNLILLMLVNENLHSPTLNIGSWRGYLED